MPVTETTSRSGGEGLARALEPRYYLDPAIYEREKQEVFYKTWQYAGHVSQVAKPGDYFAFTVLDQSLFCVRGKDGLLASGMVSADARPTSASVLIRIQSGGIENQLDAPHEPPHVGDADVGRRAPQVADEATDEPWTIAPLERNLLVMHDYGLHE